MSTIPLKQQNRDLFKKLEQTLNSLELSNAKLNQLEARFQQLQRSVNAFHIRHEALKMASTVHYDDESTRLTAIQFEKWLIEGFESGEKKDSVVDKTEEE